MDKFVLGMIMCLLVMGGLLFALFNYGHIGGGTYSMGALIGAVFGFVLAVLAEEE